MAATSRTGCRTPVSWLTAWRATSRGAPPRTGQRPVDLGRIDAPRGRGAEPDDVDAARGEHLGGAGHRRVLEPARHAGPREDGFVRACERAGEGEVVGFGSPRREDDVARREANQIGQGFARPFDDRLGRAPHAMKAGGIAPRRSGGLGHGRGHVRMKRGGGVPIEVDGAHTKAISASGVLFLHHEHVGCTGRDAQEERRPGERYPLHDLFGRGLEAHVTPEPARDAPCDGEPHPDAAMATGGRAVDLVERFEEHPRAVGGEPRAGVGDAELVMPLGERGHSDADVAPLGRELCRVIEQLHHGPR